ncbi:HYR-like domain-containing protein, partial [Zhouia amylolytica]
VDSTDNTDPCNIIVTRTWTFTDSCDNTTSVSQTITVADTTAPVAPAAPEDVTVECTDEIPPMIDLTATDNCDSNITVTGVDTTDNTDPCNIIVTRTWTFTDSCDNTASVSQTITVADTTAPTFTAPDDITIECNQDASDLTLTGDVTDEADNCATGLEATFTDATNPGACANEYTIIRTWTLTDDCDNTTMLEQTINVVDTTDPSIDTTNLENLSIECDGSGNNDAITNWLANNAGATATDNCGQVTWTNNYGGTVSDCATPIEVIFTATDACGNQATVTATYAITDNTPPTITTPASDLTVQCDGAGNTTALQNWLD